MIQRYDVCKFLCFIFYVWLAFYGSAWEMWIYSRDWFPFLCHMKSRNFFPRRHYYTLRTKRKLEMKKMCALRSMIKYRTEIRQCGIIIIGYRYPESRFPYVEEQLRVHILYRFGYRMKNISSRWVAILLSIFYFSTLR